MLQTRNGGREHQKDIVYNYAAVAGAQEMGILSDVGNHLPNGCVDFLFDQIGNGAE
jgi:hypothetical protein